ncbi:MAG: DUF1592 domain-containing protein [Myxococcales bacterium]|nr:DUF1592 domain-containing protein [Myxococcales bacterium]
MRPRPSLHLRLIPLRAFALALLLAGCSGHIGDPHAPPSSPQAPAVPPATSGIDGADFAARCKLDAPQTPAAAPPQRLTTREYLATVEQLLGRSVDGLAALLPKDPLHHGYDNQSAKLSLTASSAESFVDAAEHIAKAVAADAALRARLSGCDLDASAAAARQSCLQKLVIELGRRAFRRPLAGAADAVPDAESEVGKLLAMARAVGDRAAGASDNPYGAHADVAAVVAAIFASPHFLVRVSAGHALADRPGVRALDSYELAARLSYLVWGSTPDDALLAAAAAGTLDSEAGLAAEATRLLDDARAQTHLHDFFHQWLALGTVFKGNLDTSRFPEYSPALQSAMYEEMRRLVADHAFAPGADLMALFTARRSHVNAALAALYGVAAPAASPDAFAPVTFDASSLRAGLLSTAGVLAMTSNPTEASVVNRGLFVRERLLCQDVPPPPPNVPDIDPRPDESPGAAQDRHSSDPQCKGCHALIDPIGNGLEAYDALGKLRSDAAQHDARALARHIAGIDDSSFFGAPELGAILSRRAEVRRCIVSNVVRWGLGRGIDGAANGDVCAAATIDARFVQSKHSFRELIIALVSSASFREKRVDGVDASCQ